MSKRKKRLEKIRQNPKTVRIKELDVVLRDFGFTPDFTEGSHTTYRHETGLRVTVAAHGQQHIAAYIVKQAIAAIDSILETADDTED